MRWPNIWGALTGSGTTVRDGSVSWKKFPNWKERPGTEGESEERVLEKDLAHYGENREMKAQNASFLRVWGRK